MHPEDLRASLPLNGAAYLNTGASGPSPRRVRDAMHDALAAHDTAHTDGEPYSHEAELAAEAREAVAGVVGAPFERVALTSNTTDGINVAADCFDWGTDDTVVTTALEHPAGTLPWQRLAEVHGVGVLTVPTVDDAADALDLDAYKDAVADATLVCLSSVSWYGVRLSVDELISVAHDAGAEVVVDAAQSVGAEAVDVTDWDAEYVAAPSHKWLLGPWGAGFVYVAPDASCDAQTRVGYKSASAPNDSSELHGDARRFEVSTRSPALLAGTAEAARVHTELGATTVERRISRLVSRLEDALGDRHLSTGGGLVRFSDETPEATVERLRSDGVVVRALPNGDLRASVHVFNTTDDVDALVEAL